MKAIGCGVIGYGAAFDMGRTHAEAIQGTPGLEMRAVCDADPTRLAAARKDLPAIAAFSNHEEMLRMEGLDLVVVVTPHHTHADLAISCLRSGKHVVVEKPMCLTVAEGRRMLQAAKDRGVILSVFHNRRWDGSHVALKRILGSGDLGEVFQIEAFSGGYAHPGHWWRSDKEISGGCLHDWGAHFIDWILDLVPGPVTEVSGFIQKRRWMDVTNEDHALMTMRFENGVVAAFEQSTVAASPKERFRILGTKGAATWKGEDEEFWTVTLGSPVGPSPSRRVPFAKRDWTAYYRNLAGALQGSEELAVTGEQCLRIVSMIEAAEESARLGRAVIPEVG